MPDFAVDVHGPDVFVPDSCCWEGPGAREFVAREGIVLHHAELCERPDDVGEEVHVVHVSSRACVASLDVCGHGGERPVCAAPHAA